jgi:hypothetical protein
MRVRRLNRVELLLPAEDIPDAVQVFNDALGGHLPEPEDLDDVKVRTTTDFAMGIELFGPLDDTSPLAGVFDRKPRRGSIGPIVWEVEDLDATRAFVESQGYRVVYEFGSPGQRQIHLDEDQLFGFGLTFTEQSREDAGSPMSFGAKFQRVELMVDGEHIESAREAFAELLGASFSPTRHYPGPDILSSTDDFVGLELLAPASATSQIAPLFQAKGRGGIGPLVWKVDDLDEATKAIVDRGYGIQYEFGEPGGRQVHFDAGQFFGFGVTITERELGQQL